MSDPAVILLKADDQYWEILVGVLYLIIDCQRGTLRVLRGSIRNGRTTTRGLIFEGRIYSDFQDDIFTGDIRMLSGVMDRIRAAINFFNWAPRNFGMSYPLSASSMYWAGIAVQDPQSEIPDGFDRFVRAPMVSALTDVFGDEMFAREVVRRCPGNKLPESGLPVLEGEGE